MELMVVIAIIITLSSIAYAVVKNAQVKRNELQAITTMKNLGSALSSYLQEHDGLFPNEDASGPDNWDTVRTPDAEKAWYNAIPRKLNAKGVGDLPDWQTFYTKENFLYLPGARYPERTMSTKPHFAIAINTKLHRKDKDGNKPELRLTNIQLPMRTVAFLEQGLPGEERAHSSISRRDYDGSCKGSAKSFVARYHGKGMISFLDGGVQEVAGKDLLDNSGKIIWDPANKSGIFWCADPESDPNN